MDNISWKKIVKQFNLIKLFYIIAYQHLAVI